MNLYYESDSLKHYGVLGMKWGVRRARRKEATRQYKKTGDRTAYNRAKKDKSNDAEIANRLYSKQSKGANKRVTEMSMGEALVQSALMGSFGALKYNEAKARGVSTGKAAVEGVLYNAGNTALSGLLGWAQYFDNRFARG